MLGVHQPTVPFFTVPLCHFPELHELLEMVSLKTAPIPGEANNSPQFFRHLLWERSKERFCEQILLWIPLTSRVKTSQSMPFLLGAHSSTVKLLSKENTLKSTPLSMTNPEKMCSANRDSRSKAAQEATPSCQAACHNTHTQFFSSKILLTLLDPASCCLMVKAVLKKLGAGCALLYLFSSEQGKSSPWLSCPAESTSWHGGSSVLPRGYAGGLKTDFVISAAAAIMDPKEAYKQNKNWMISWVNLGLVTTECKSNVSRKGMGERWSFPAVRPRQEQGAAESALEPKQWAAIPSGPPAIPRRFHPVLPTPKLSPH